MKATEAEACDFVLSVVANDYESQEIILRDVTAWAKEEGKAIDEAAILGALSHLVESGLIDCFEYVEQQQCFVKTPSLTPRPRESWYLISEAGRAALR